MKPSTKSRYSKSVAAIEKVHYVPLRTRYWDEVGVEIKELTSPRKSLKAFDGVWVPTESTMTDLLEGLPEVRQHLGLVIGHHDSQRSLHSFPKPRPTAVAPKRICRSGVSFVPVPVPVPMPETDRREVRESSEGERRSLCATEDSPGRSGTGRGTGTGTMKKRSTTRSDRFIPSSGEA